MNSIKEPHKIIKDIPKNSLKLANLPWQAKFLLSLVNSFVFYFILLNFPRAGDTRENCYKSFPQLPCRTFREQFCLFFSFHLMKVRRWSIKGDSRTHHCAKNFEENMQKFMFMWDKEIFLQNKLNFVQYYVDNF